MATPMDESVDPEDIPSELQGRLSNFDEALSKIEEIFEPLHSVPLSDVHAKINSLDKAKLDLIGVYAINSLFWMYLNTKGENPKDHQIKTELDRIRSNMNKVKEIQEKQNAPKIDKDASKRFVRSALWQMAHKKAKGGIPGAATVSAAPPTSSAQPAAPPASSARPATPETITIPSQDSDSGSEESPAKKPKPARKKRGRPKKKK